MGFTKRLIYFLVHTLSISNKDASKALADGFIKVNGIVVNDNIIIGETDEITYKNDVVKKGREFIYIKFYKPIGFESTLNKKNEHGLYSFFKDYPDLSIAGRLDKASEGLLLLSNDGKWIQTIIHPTNNKEKIYEVELNAKVNDEFINQFEQGVIINKSDLTRPCKCEKLSATRLKIHLTEGKHRQIRKMCKSLGYEVIALKRIEINGVKLDGLEIVKWDFFKI